ncbi:MAG: hypothetical protein LBD46_08470 [Endomicrobium sp.]|jgi:hypothetical protein|nr:hypothetical protein [Endomicrobium sp.]
MKIPTRENRVAPNAPSVTTPNLSAPPEAVFGGQIGQAVDNLGKNVSRFEQILNNIKLQEDENKIKKFENNLSAYNADLRNKLKTGQIQPATLEDLYKQYNDEVAKNGESALGKDLFSAWSAGRGADFNKGHQYNLAFDYSVQKYDKNIIDIKDLGRIAAVNAAAEADSVKAAAIMQDYHNSVNNGQFVPKDKEIIIKAANHEWSLAEVSRDINANPAGALLKLQTPSKSSKSNPPHYQYLDATERERFINAAQQGIKSREGTTQDARLEPFRNYFHMLFQTNSDMASRYYRDLINEPASMSMHINDGLLTADEKKALQSGLRDLTAKEKETYFSWMEKILTDKDRNYATRNADFYENLQMQVKLFDIDNQGRIKNKDLNNVESLVNIIGTVEGGRRDGSLSNYDQQSAKMLAQLRGALGTLVEEEGFKLRDENRFSHSVSEAAKKAILNDLRLLDKNLGAGRGIFTKQQVGALTEAVWKEYIKAGIDTKSSESQDVANALNIERDILRTQIKNWLNIGDKQFDAVLYGGALLPYYSQSNFSNVRDMITGNRSIAGSIYENLLPIGTDTARTASQGLQDEGRTQRAAVGSGRVANRALEDIGGYVEDHTYTTRTWDDTVRRYREVTRFRSRANSDIVLRQSPRRRSIKENNNE